MTRVLVIKTGALGDVIRTTSILPGLAKRYDDVEVVWVTAPGAASLVEHHPLISRVEKVDPGNIEAARALAARLGAETWDRVLSFDDEEPMCALASGVGGESLSGAHFDSSGARAYTDDVAPWFEMGLLSRLGKEEADRLKIANQRTHPEIFASMLGVEEGRPALHLTGEAREQGKRFYEQAGLPGTVIGLNTGAGGRWKTKELPVPRTVRVAAQIGEALECGFVVLGGPDEAERNSELCSGLESAGLAFADGGTDNGLLEFGALVGGVDLLIASDSMALHMAIALERPCVAFFAPTSAAEIELYGLGQKVWSTAPDYCSYTPDADNSTLTARRIADAALEVLRG